MTVKKIHYFGLFVLTSNIVMAMPEDFQLKQIEAMVRRGLNRVSYHCHTIKNAGAETVGLSPAPLDVLKREQFNFDYRVVDMEALEAGSLAGFFATLANEWTLKGKFRDHVSPNRSMNLRESTAVNCEPMHSVQSTQSAASAEVCTPKKFSVFRRNPAFRALVFCLPAWLVYQHVVARNNRLLSINCEHEVKLDIVESSDCNVENVSDSTQASAGTVPVDGDLVK